MKITGKQFVKAIIAILKEKNKKSVSFDPRTYGSELTKNELPWCNAFDCMVDTIGCPELVIGDDTFEESVEFTDEDKAAMKAKGYPDCIWICVDDGGAVKYDFFDGTENEDFDHLFHDVYDELWDGGINDDEGDIWLYRFIGEQDNEGNAC